MCPPNPWEHFQLKSTLLRLEKITKTRVWLDPSCCREGQNYIETGRSALSTWDKCNRPDFLCWYLDVYRSESPGMIPAGTPPTRTPWRLILYRDFFLFECKVPRFLVRFILSGVKSSRRYAMWVFWFVTGYFDSVRLDKVPAWWWIHTAGEIKEEFQSIRVNLSDKE